MTKVFLEFLIVSLIGTTITIAGQSFSAADILQQTKTVVNEANVRQLATAVELYYADHQTYPRVAGGEALVEELFRKEYIERKPIEPSVFRYQIRENGQAYTLALGER